MTVKQVRSVKKRLGKQFDRIAKVINKMGKLPKLRKVKVMKELKRDLKKEEKVIIRIQKRCSRLAKAA